MSLFNPENLPYKANRHEDAGTNVADAAHRPTAVTCYPQVYQVQANFAATQERALRQRLFGINGFTTRLFAFFAIDFIIAVALEFFNRK